MAHAIIRQGSRFSVYAWEDDSGCQVLKFLEQLRDESNTDAERIAYLIERTSELGPPSNERQCKLLDDGIYEFKAPNGARVLWFYDEGGLIICTHGFVKKKPKTPREEIKRAKKIRTKYLEEKGNEQ
jgi:phage-related protein